MDSETIQTALNAAGFGPLVVDGKFGRKSTAALTAFQQANRLTPTGKLDSATATALFPFSAKADVAPLALATLQWPYEKDMSAFYGAPGNPLTTAGIVALPIKFRIAWDTSSLVSTFRCHVKCVEAFTRIFDEAVEHYGEKDYRALGLDLFGGCYNLRKMRGGSAWSIHSWGAAFDVDPERNGLYNKSTPSIRNGEKLPAAELSKREYIPFWNIVAKYGGYSLGVKENRDWMHFQFARR